MTNAPILRVLDASLNRAGEGLRVVEDYARFVLDSAFLTHQIKSLRHDLAAAAAAIPSSERHAARDTQLDVGTNISTAAESNRTDAWAVCAANLKRTEQSLRSLEEYGKLAGGTFASRCESLRYRLYTLEKALVVDRSSHDRLAGVKLCVLVGGGPSAKAFELLVKSLLDAGVGMLQLRDKELDDRELVQRARILVSLTNGQPPAEPRADKSGRNLAIINDRADIAALVNADGVHVGQNDLSVKDARTIVGPRALIGVSTHNIDQARAAVLDGANYLGAGPTFASRTKSFDNFAGLEYLKSATNEISLPTFAIGGINAENLPQVLAAGITRVAVSAAVTAAANPASAAAELLAMLKR